MDTASQKYLTLQGVPTAHYRRRMYARFPLGCVKRLKLWYIRVPLTNNAQFRVAPGESTSNSKARRALESVSIVCRRFGVPVNSDMRPGPQPDRLDQQGNHVPTGPACF